MPLKVPILTPDRHIPRSIKLYRESLPDYLQPDQLLTKDDIPSVGGVSEERARQLIDQRLSEALVDINALIARGSAKVFTQETPVTVADLRHDFMRDGPVSVQVYSFDYQFVWEFFEIHHISRDVVRLVFDDPTAFHAIVL